MDFSRWGSFPIVNFIKSSYKREAMMKVKIGRFESYSLRHPNLFKSFEIPSF
jgi:hypothetical protein